MTSLWFVTVVVAVGAVSSGWFFLQELRQAIHRIWNDERAARVRKNRIGWW